MAPIDIALLGQGAGSLVVHGRLALLLCARHVAGGIDELLELSDRDFVATQGETTLEVHGEARAFVGGTVLLAVRRAHLVAAERDHHQFRPLAAGGDVIGDHITRAV